MLNWVGLFWLFKNWWFLFSCFAQWQNMTECPLEDFKKSHKGVQLRSAWMISAKAVFLAIRINSIICCSFQHFFQCFYSQIACTAASRTLWLFCDNTGLFRRESPVRSHNIVFLIFSREGQVTSVNREGCQNPILNKPKHVLQVPFIVWNWKWIDFIWIAGQNMQIEKVLFVFENLLLPLCQRLTNEMQEQLMWISRW